MDNLLKGKLFIDAALVALGIYGATKEGIGSKIVGAVVIAAGIGDGYYTVKEIEKISTEEHGVF